MNFIRTDSSNNHFQQLVVLLDAHLKVTDGDAHDFYNQFNKITHIRHVIVAFIDEQPVGCGAFKEYSTDSVEIKRMFVMPEHRGCAKTRRENPEHCCSASIRRKFICKRISRNSNKR